MREAQADIRAFHGMEIGGLLIRVRFDKDVTPGFSAHGNSLPSKAIIRLHPPSRSDSDASVRRFSIGSLSLESQASSTGPVIVNGSTAGVDKRCKSTSSSSS